MALAPTTQSVAINNEVLIPDPPFELRDGVRPLPVKRREHAEDLFKDRAAGVCAGAGACLPAKRGEYGSGARGCSEPRRATIPIFGKRPPIPERRAAYGG